MKNLSIILSVVLFSCNQAAKKEIPGVPYNPEDYYHSKIIMVPGPEVDTTKVLMIAKDNQQNWECKFYYDRIELVTNYHKDTFSISNDLAGAVKYNILLNPFKLEKRDKSFSLEILAEDCIRKSDDDLTYPREPKKIIIHHNKITLKGCVSLADSAARY
jgi:hypothetical protein